jgi:hypothetical protein
MVWAWDCVPSRNVTFPLLTDETLRLQGRERVVSEIKRTHETVFTRGNGKPFKMGPFENLLKFGGFGGFGLLLVSTLSFFLESSKRKHLGHNKNQANHSALE